MAFRDGRGGAGAEAGVEVAGGWTRPAARRASRREFPAAGAGTAGGGGGAAAAGCGDCVIGIFCSAGTAACMTGVLGFCPAAVDFRSCSRTPGAKFGRTGVAV